MLCKLYYAHGDGDMVPFKVLCAVRFHFKATDGPLYICLSNYLLLCHQVVIDMT